MFRALEQVHNVQWHQTKWARYKKTYNYTSTKQFIDRSFTDCRG